MVNNKILIVLIVVAFIVFASTNYDMTDIKENYWGNYPLTAAVHDSRSRGGYVNPYNDHNEKSRCGMVNSNYDNPNNHQVKRVKFDEDSNTTKIISEEYSHEPFQDNKLDDVIYDRNIFHATLKSRLRSQSDVFRGDLYIKPTVQHSIVSANPHIDLHHGAMNVMSGVTGDAHQHFVNSGKTIYGGVDMSDHFAKIHGPEQIA